MVCIKRYLTPLLFVLALLLGACAQTPTDKHKEVPEATAAPEASAEEAAKESGDATEPALELIPNPYLANPPSVPGRAKEEFAKALAAMGAKQWKQAEGLLTLMTETYPTLSGPYVNLGICYYHQEAWDKAETALKQAISVNKTNMDAYTWLGVLYREQGQFEKAEQTYLAALEVWPHHAESHRNLGILYDLYMGRFKEALEHYKMLQRLTPEEDRQVKGWILDLERRLEESGAEQ